MHTAPYFAALGLLTIVHALRVILLRRKHKVGIGNGGVPELERMIRVFGNHAEFVPIGLILLIALEFVQAPVWYCHAVGLTLLLGRVLHAMGLSRTAGASAGRAGGTLLTLVSLLLSSVGIIIFSLLVRP